MFHYFLFTMKFTEQDGPPLPSLRSFYLCVRICVCVCVCVFVWLFLCVCARVFVC
jgi:hypothetical protein